MALTEVLPKFRALVGLSLIGALTEMLPTFRANPEINDDKVEEENEGEGVRTEGADRSDDTARRGAARQGTPAKNMRRDSAALFAGSASRESRGVTPGENITNQQNRFDSETDEENDDDNLNGERVRTEGAGRPGESARGGAARQGTHAEK